MQTKYNSYRSRSGSYQRKESADRGAWEQINVLRVAFCLVLLGGVFALKTYFPESAQAVRSVLLPMIEQDFDYRGAVAAIGETLTGDDSITEVLGNLYMRAFGGNGEEDVEVLNEAEEEEEPEAAAPKASYTPIEEVISIPTSLPVSETQEPAEEMAEEVAEEADVEPEAVSVFLAQQEQYSDYELPASVTYDYITLTLDYAVPVSGTVSSPFGYRFHPIDELVKFHYGTDVAATVGTPIGAFASGTVIEAAENDSYGKYIIIDHGQGVTTRYAHCNALYKQVGDTVEMGETIAEVGETGNVTGPHLHFELKVNGMYLNPEYYLTFA